MPRLQKWKIVGRLERVNAGCDISTKRDVGMQRKPFSLIVLILICVIPIVGLTYLFVPTPVSTTLTLPLTEAVATFSARTNSYTHWYYSVNYSTFSDWFPCVLGYRDFCFGAPQTLNLACVARMGSACWYFCDGGRMGGACWYIITTSAYTIGSTTLTSTWTSSLTSYSWLTSTSQTLTTGTTLPPSALYPEGNVATIVLMVILVVGLCYLLFLVMNRGTKLSPDRSRAEST